MTGKKREGSVAKATTGKKMKTTSKAELLGIIAHFQSLHKGKAPLNKVARRAGYGTATNNSFRKALSRAAKDRLLEATDADVQLTDKGRSMAEDASDFVLTNASAQAKIRENLTPKMQMVFDFALEQHPAPVPYEVLVEKLDYENTKSQGFLKLLSRMRNADAIETADNAVTVSNMAFPENE